MELRFVAAELGALDELRCDVLLLPIASDERPLRGAAGLVDWRLCGALSRLIAQGRVTGARGERVLVPTRPRLSFEKLVLLGTGSRLGFDETVFRTSIDAAMDVLRKLRARTAALALPGRSLEGTTAERGLELFLGAAGDLLERDEITVVETSEAQRLMLPVLERARRKARALESG